MPARQSSGKPLPPKPPFLGRSEGGLSPLGLDGVRFGHCLNDLLYRWSTGQLKIEIPLIVSNHTDFQALAQSCGIPYAHVPVTKDTKDQAEERLLELIEEHDVDLVVLARYMQVLSDDLCKRLSGRVINIHHSFLPSFKGAKPYHQAYDRGVKVVGATAHHVTPDLDEGPIIEQDRAKAERVARRLRHGTVWINDFGPYLPQAEWGGFKRSGIGRELGPSGLAEYREAKHIYENTDPRPQNWFAR